MRWLSNIVIALMCMLLIPGSISALESTSTMYQLQHSAFDSGGIKVSTPTSSVVIPFQSVSPLTTGVTNRDSQKVVQGQHFTSHVVQVDGYKTPFERADVTLNATVLGLMTSKVGYAVKKPDNTMITIPETNALGAKGWTLLWDSIETIPNEVTVSIMARAFDGLTYGPWFTALDSVIVDNLKPVISSLVQTNPSFSPNNASSIGVKDQTHWLANINETYLNDWHLNVLTYFSEEKVTENPTVNVTWGGTSTTNAFVADGVYPFLLKVSDKAGNITNVTGNITVDNTSPVVSNVLLAASGGALNSGVGNLNSSWDVSDNLTDSPVIRFNYKELSFNPRLVSGMYLWFDAPYMTSMLTAGDKVISWQDRGMYRGSLHQVITAYQPVLSENALNDHDVVVFDGINDVMQIPTVSFSIDEVTLWMVIGVTPNSTEESYWLSVVSDNESVFDVSTFPTGHALAGHVAVAAKPLSTGIKINAVSNTPVITDSDYHLVQLKVSQGKVSIVVDTETVVTFNQDLDRSGAIQGKLRLGGMSESSFVSEMGLAELLMYDEDLSNEDRDKVFDYLNIKWGIERALGWQTVTSNANRFSKVDVDDYTHFTAKVEAEDDAGNIHYIHTSSVFTPDRTAPVIDTDFYQVTGTEDINFTVNPTPYKTDNASLKKEMVWSVAMYTQSEDPIRSAEEVFQVIRVTNNAQEMDFVLVQHANIDPLVNPPLDGNIYGKSEAWMKVQLTDAEGNWVSKDIQLHVTPVNDAPEFTNDVGSGYIERDVNQNIIYNLKFDEDTQSPIITLDDYVVDVDNLKSDLTWIVTGNTFYQDAFLQNNHVNYTDTQITVSVSDETLSHQMQVLPRPDFWGDVTFDIKVSDTVGSANQQLFTTRVWPVNDIPVIKPGFAAISTDNEDTAIVLDLTAFEDDAYGEDAPPTLNTNLKWSVEYDSSLITQVTGENSGNDVLTFVPQTHGYGSATVTFKLTDTDSYPQSIYPNTYVPNPKFATKSMTLTWHPVNDAPVIGAIAAQVASEDATAWQIDLSSFKSDIEDPNAKLHWTVAMDKSNMVTLNKSAGSDIVTLTPIANAWGTANVMLTLTDMDDGIVFDGYTPQPITVTKNVSLSLYPVNDSPSLTGTQMLGQYSPRTDLVMTNDKITVYANTFQDIGVANSQAQANVIGDEYNQALAGVLGFVPNQELHHYRWYVGEGANKVLTKEVLNSTSPTNALAITPDLEGKLITVETWPDDGVDEGATFTKAIRVNTLPLHVSVPSASPVADHYTNTGNVDIAWTTVTDANTQDSDNIGYRTRIWKKNKWGAPPADVSLTATDHYYDSGWQKDFTDIPQDMMASLYGHGTYYWTVWTGNQFSETVWDYQQPNWLNHFNVDLVDPTQLRNNKLLKVSELSHLSRVSDAGRTRVLLGAKPADADDSYLYQIILESTNELDGVISTESVVIVPFTTSKEWSYEITYPEGITTYNLLIQDYAGNFETLQSRTLSGLKPLDATTYNIRLDYANFHNAVTTNGSYVVTKNATDTRWTYTFDYLPSTTNYTLVSIVDNVETVVDTFVIDQMSKKDQLYTFTIIDDKTPPEPFKINGQIYAYFEDLSSKNYYFVSGTKEPESRLVYEGYNTHLNQVDKTDIVGFTDSDQYGFFIYSTKPSGNVYAEDRAGNIAVASTNINIRFLLGAPPITTVTQNRIDINTPANSASLLAQGLSSSQVNELTRSSIQWRPDRKIMRYAFENADGEVIVSGNQVNPGETITTDILGDSLALSHGTNSVYLVAYDEALNKTTNPYIVKVYRHAPDGDIINLGTSLTKVRVGNTDVWRLVVYGSTRSGVTARVNGADVQLLNNNTWQYLDLDFDPTSEDVTLELFDVVNNKTTRTLWGHQYYSSYGSLDDITLPISEVDSIVSSVILSVGQLPSGISSLHDITLKPEQPISEFNLNRYSVRRVFEAKPDMANLKLQEESKKAYQIYGRDLSTSVVSDIDLEHSEVEIGVPYVRSPMLEEESLVVVRYDDITDQWVHVPNPSVVDTQRQLVVTTITESGVYAVGEAVALQDDLSKLRVYPNPWVPNDGDPNTGTLSDGILFDYLTTDTRIRIYTVSGQLVVDESPGTAHWEWLGTNKEGVNVFSGVYLYIVEDGQSKRTGKLTIIR